MAKRAVVKDRRFFEAVGYPKDYEIIRLAHESTANDVAAADVGEGSFRVIGDKCVTRCCCLPQLSCTRSKGTNSIRVPYS